MEIPSKNKIEELRKEFGKNKKIPKKYEAAILTALSHYPELKSAKIRFEMKNRNSVPYGTTPALKTIFKEPSEREYIVAILERAKEPMHAALMKNLSFEAQVGVMGHEIAHVVQFSSCSRVQLLKFLALYLQPKFQKRIERGADLAAIVHGLGEELLEHALYIRSIPGYVEERKSINKNYLKPAEIVHYLKR